MVVTHLVHSCKGSEMIFGSSHTVCPALNDSFNSCRFYVAAAIR